MYTHLNMKLDNGDEFTVWTESSACHLLIWDNHQGGQGRCR